MPLYQNNQNDLTGFTTSLNTTSPNTTTNVAQLLANTTSTDGDIVLSPLGNGAILARVPDGTATGGNKRGSNAIDLSIIRNSATQVASGTRSINLAFSGTASGSYSVNLASYGTASGSPSVNLAPYGTASGNSSVNLATSGVASGSYSVNLAHYGTASGDYSTNLGYGGTASGQYSVNLAGSGVASGQLSTCFGYRGDTKSIYGKAVFSGGIFTATGDCQVGFQILKGVVTDTAPKILTANNSTASTTNQIQLQNNQTIKVKCDIVARSSTGLTKNIEIVSVLKRGATASTTTCSTPIVETILQDSGTENWTMVLTADTSNGCGAITFTVDSAINVRCMAKVETIELTY
jgi:hypothetical protein